MPDITPVPEPSPAPAATPVPAPRSPFNKEQLAEITIAGNLIAAANESEHSPLLLKLGITPAWLIIFEGKLTLANGLTTKAIETREGTAEDTDEALITRYELTQQLVNVQKAAKQKQRMWDTDDDPTTNFSTDGYLIGKRLSASMEKFLANARALLSKATSDDLPGIDAEAIADLAAAIAAHQLAEQSRPSGREDSGKVTAERNALLAQIISNRIALQHAADRAYPPGNPLTTPSRTRFHLDPDRSFNG